MAARRYRVDEVRPVLVETWGTIRSWLDEVRGDDLARPSALPGWSNADLVAHLGLGLGALMSAESTDAANRAPAMSVEEWMRIYPKVAAGIDRATREHSEATGHDLLGALDEQWAQALEALAARGDDDGAVLVRVQRIPWSELLVTRLVELVVHGDDLARSLPSLTPPAIPSSAQRIVVRSLLDVLAARAPGNSLEVRVPPFAAVQCVEGPRHTRGTPPNVVETDPWTWIRMACGRIGWDEALSSHAVQASGSRADLGDLLPLL